MWQLRDSIFNTGPGRCIAAVRVAPLLLAMLASCTFLNAAEPQKANRRIQVMCDCRENQPAGTLITQLGDHNLTLKNFRAAQSQDLLQFTVDTESGAVFTAHDDQLDFESERAFQIRVLADEELENDKFLAEFSASLADAGLAENDLKSLTVSTVVFDITVRLTDVSEGPILDDSHFSVELASDALVEFGRIETGSESATPGWQFYIVSGNEDGFFEIDPTSGILTLNGAASCNSDRQSDFELELMVENSAGEFEVSNVFVKVHREVPEIVSDVDSATPSSLTPSATNTPEEDPVSDSLEPSAELVRNDIAVRAKDETHEIGAEIIGRPSDTFNAQIVETEAELSHNSLPNVKAIDADEVQQWVAGDEGATRAHKADSLGVNAGITPSLPIAESVSNSAPQILLQDSPGYLLTLGAFSIFLAACIIVILIWSRAAAKRAGRIDGEASEERLTAALNDIQHEEELRLLRSELADRDQTILQLKKQLRSITLDFESDDNDEDDNGKDERHVERDRKSWGDCPTPSLSDSRLSQEQLQVISVPDRDSLIDARTSLGAAFEQIGRKLERETLSLTSPVSSIEDAGEFLCESTQAAVATLEDPQDLRSELDDLFAMQGPGEPETSTSWPNLTVDNEPDTVSSNLPNQEFCEEQNEESALEVHENMGSGSEDLHLDSVKLYLSKLLERSQEATSAESILVDRRKTTDSNQSIDRRAKPEPKRAPVKSFLDDYLLAHGGELADFAEKAATESFNPTPNVALEPPKPRPPVDVDSIRESMNSFRMVAIQSSEHALLSHLLREAKTKVAWRTVMLAGLAGITGLVFLANMKHVINFSSLNWLMSSLVVLSIVELCLRIHAVIKQRRNVTSSVMPPRQAGKTDVRLWSADSISE